MHNKQIKKNQPEKNVKVRWQQVTNEKFSVYTLDKIKYKLFSGNQVHVFCKIKFFWGIYYVLCFCLSVLCPYVCLSVSLYFSQLFFLCW